MLLYHRFFLAMPNLKKNKKNTINLSFYFFFDVEINCSSLNIHIQIFYRVIWYDRDVFLTSINKIFGNISENNYWLRCIGEEPSPAAPNNVTA